MGKVGKYIAGYRCDRSGHIERDQMQKYEVEFACFRKVVFEAGSQQRAQEIAAVMEDEEIEKNSYFKGYEIWDGPGLID